MIEIYAHRFRFVFMLPILAMLYGCPTGADYPLSEKPEAIDPKLIGTWESVSGEAEILEVRIQKKDEQSYLTEVLSGSEFYSLNAKKFTSWLTIIDGETFLYSQPVDDAEDKKYYLYHIKFDGNNLIIQDVGLLVGGVDAIQSISAYRTEVAASMKKPECLSSPHEYQRTE